MRSLILTAVLGLGALGIVGALPTDAKAYPPRWSYVNNYSVGPYATTTRVGNPYLNYYSRPYGAGITYASPAYMHAYRNPTGYGAFYASPAVVSQYYSLYGLGYYLSTPAYRGYSYSPYTGYRQFSVPGSTINVPYGAGGYYNSYVPSNYILR